MNILMIFFPVQHTDIFVSNYLKRPVGLLVDRRTISSQPEKLANYMLVFRPIPIRTSILYIGIGVARTNDNIRLH